MIVFWENDETFAYDNNTVDQKKIAKSQFLCVFRFYKMEYAISYSRFVLWAYEVLFKKKH